jgi:glucokinase
VGRLLAPALGLPLIDKDEILEHLFETRGVGDAAWRRKLSRESDAILQAEAMAASVTGGAVLVSFWRLQGMPPDSGTPVDWLPELSGQIVNVHCDCSPEVAAARFTGRKRHAGHLDEERRFAEVLSGIRMTAGLGWLEIGRRVVVDTTRECRLELVIGEVEEAFSGAV